MTKPNPRVRRWLLASAVLGTALVALVLSAARVFLHGDDLGEFVATMLNKRMRGRIDVGAIEWPISALPTVIKGGWVPVTARNVTLWDDCMQSSEGRARRAATGAQIFVADLPCAPDDRRAPGLTPRKKLLRTEKITAEIDVHALIFGNHDLVFRNLRVHGGEVLLEQAAEPYPLHDYDKTTISLISAFQPRMTPGFRAGIFADNAPPIFDLRDVHLEGIGLTYHQRPELRKDGSARYPVTLRVENVAVDAGASPQNHAFLYANNRDPLLGKLYLSVPITAGPATLRIDEEGPAEAFALGPLSEQQMAARKARYIIPIASIDVQRLAQLPRRWAQGDPIASTLELRLTARTEKGGILEVSGELRDYKSSTFSGTWALDVVGRNLGPTLTASIDPAISGDDVTAQLRLRGPFVANPRIEYQLSGLRYDTLRPKLATDPPALRLALANLEGELDLVNDQGRLKETIAEVLGADDRPTGGKIRLDATFGLKPYQVNNADITILDAIDLGRFLPPAARQQLGRYIRGHVSGNGDTTSGFALRDIDLAIGPTPTEVRARLHGGRIFTADNFSTLEVARDQPLQARMGETTTAVSGRVLARARWLDLRLGNVDSPDLGRWLTRLGVTPLATSAQDGEIAISGRMEAPAVDARASLAGVPVVGQLSVDAHLENQVLDLRRVESATLGGALAGKGRIRVGPRPFVESLTLAGQRLSADKLATATGRAGIASGTIDNLDVSLHGALTRRPDPLDWLDLVDAYVQSDNLTVAGQSFDGIGVCVSHAQPTRPLCRRRDASLGDADEVRCDDARRKGGTCVIAHASHAEGGDLDFLLAKTPGAPPRRGAAPSPSDLAGTLDVSALPLRILDGVAGPGALGGTIGTRLAIGGTSAAWTASGVIELLRGWALGSFYGDSRLVVTPVTTGKRGLRVTGSALGGRLTLDATLGTAPPYPVDVKLSGRRIELDPLLGGTLVAGLPVPVRAWATGQVHLTTDLVPAPGSRAARVGPELWIELSELEAVIDSKTGDAPAPLRIGAISAAQGKPAVSVYAAPKSQRFELACATDAPDQRVPCPVTFATPAGTLTIEGTGSASELALRGGGTLDLSLLDLSLVSALFGLPLDELSGSLAVQANLVGPLASLQPEINVRPQNLRIRPAGQETVVQVPGGLVRLANGSVAVTGVRLLVDDVHQRERGELSLMGGVSLKGGLHAPVWNITLDGKIPGRLFMLAPTVFSQASGVVTLDPPLRLLGKGVWPQIRGGMVFDRAAPLAIIPRGFPRELAFREGEITLGTTVAADGVNVYSATADGVMAVIDGEGTVRNVQGEVKLRDLRPVSAQVRLDADSIPFLVPGTLDLLLTGSGIGIGYDEPTGTWRADGLVEIVSGKFIRNFDLGDLGEALRPATPPAGSNRPFWEEWPQLGSAALDLAVNVRQLAVANNIANIELKGALQVRGSPRDPRIDGNIAVQRGTFRMPGTRAEFTRTRGNVEFKQSRRFPVQNPELNLESESDYRDPSGRDHLITLSLRGTLDRLDLDLRTSTGYNRSQTLALILLGRTPDQVRQSIGDTALGSDPTRIDPTTNPSAGAADQLIKDFAGNWVSLLLGDSLEGITGLDVLRFQFDFGSIGLRGEKKITDNLRAILDVERTVRGATVNVRGELRTPFRVTLQGAYLNKDFDSEAEEDIREFQAKLVYRYFLLP